MRKPYNGTLPITSEFGNRSFKLADGSIYSDFHNGIDIGGIFPVLAAQKGRVTSVARNGIDRGGALVKGTPANYVILDHGGIQTFYWHLSEVTVNIGDNVEEGQCIGVSGRTGEATGFHLHFMVRVNGADRNPRDYVDFNSNSSINNTPMNQERRVYTVVSGDYLEGIAIKLYGDKNRIYDLISWNGIKNPNLINVGQQIVYFVNVPMPAPQPTPAENEAQKLKSQYEKEKQDLLIKHQKELEELNIKDKLEVDALKAQISTLEEKYSKQELDSRSEITARETRIKELEEKISSRETLKLNIAGINIEQIGLHILDKQLQSTGTIAKWQQKVDQWIPGESYLANMIRSFLKFDWAWVATIIGSAAFSGLIILRDMINPEQKLLLLILGIVLSVLGFITKFTFTHADRNHDGVIDEKDSVTLEQYGLTAIVTDARKDS